MIFLLTAQTIDIGTSIYYNLIHKLCIYINTFNYYQIMINTAVFAQEWASPQSKQFLKQRIRTLAKGQIVETNDKAIAEEYYRMWLEVPMSNPLQRLVRHPLLTVQDKKTIDQYVLSQQKSQLKSAGLMTTGILGIYWLFLSRSAFFQNFFNNKQRHKAFNIGRKVFGIYLAFLASMITMNSHYEKKIPNGINDMGMFKKYRITYQDKFV